jgi:hypothetical protein
LAEKRAAEEGGRVQQPSRFQLVINMMTRYMRGYRKRKRAAASQ